MDMILEMAMQYVSPFLLYLTGINVFAFVIFCYDKYMSIKGGWRVPEKKLLQLAAIGGSPAIFLSRKLVRHKTRKQPFNKFLLAIVMTQLILAVVALWWVARGGSF
ncbi:MAG: DUF1294 domain-containing protein [Nitratireductor sp.]